MNKAPILLCDGEVALLLRISKQTLRAWRTQGRGPQFLKVEGGVRYQLDDVQAYLNQGRSSAEQLAG